MGNCLSLVLYDLRSVYSKAVKYLFNMPQDDKTQIDVEAFRKELNIRRLLTE